MSPEQMEEEFPGYDDYEDRPMEDAPEWQPGECDMCAGSTPEDLERASQGGFIPVCACAIGQGAPAGECRCGPELFEEATEVQPTEANATAAPAGRPVVLEGGTGPGVLADQTRERPDLIPPDLKVVTDPEAEVIKRAREVWPEAEGFERIPGGWIFRVGAGYASITESGRVATDPQGTRSHARRWMGEG